MKIAKKTKAKATKVKKAISKAKGGKKPKVSKNQAKVQRKDKKVAPKAAKVPAKVQKTKSRAKPKAKAAAKPKVKPQKKEKKVQEKPAQQKQRRAKQPAVPKQPKGKPGYPGKLYQQFKALRKQLLEKSVNQLKDELKNNGQSSTGNKDILVDKVADGRILGRIPRCPKCFGGRPKFDADNNSYHCAGFHDDTDFKNCHSNYTAEELKREPWTKL